MADMYEMPECPPPAPQYLSYIEFRGRWQKGGRYKFHSNIGHAKNAIGQHGGGKIWMWNPTFYKWSLLYDVPQGTPYNEYPWNVEKSKKREDAAERAARDAQVKRAKDYINEIRSL